eukprot:g4753.t1
MASASEIKLEGEAQWWYPDEKCAWALGKQVSVVDNEEGDTVVTIETSEGEERSFPIKGVHPYDVSHGLLLDDVSTINNLHEAPLLDVLRRRFANDLIYTACGDVLISVNPYKPIDFLYRLVSPEEAGGEDAKPHLFKIAARALSMLDAGGKGKDQALIISGESGAGKTEASKYIMRFLVHASAATEGDSGVEQQVLESNPVLEAFGNAKTIRNDNSSRFGKFIRIHFLEKRIVGSRIDHFLLEKSRIVQQADNERNYHIFYQLCAGASDEERGALGLLSTAADYTYLSQSGCRTVDGMDDVAEFAATRRALDVIGVSSEEQQAAFRVLSAVLLLGNVQFKAIKDAGGAAGRDSVESCAVANPEVVAALAGLLGLSDTALGFALIKRLLSAGGRGSVTEVPLSAAQAEDSRNALAKAVYQRLFYWLVDRINASIATSASDGGAAQQRTRAIGILDIYGFEILQTNSFEQLCINFANEMLQQQFNEEVFVAEQQMYVREGIDWGALQFADNAACLELIQAKPLGIMLLLDEESMLGRASDDNLLKKLHKAHLDKHPNYSKPRFASPEFIVKHFAGAVAYDITGFVDKNNDALTHDLTVLMSQTKFDFLGALFAIDLAAHGGDSSQAGEGKAGGAVAPAAKHGRGNRGTAMAQAVTVSSRYRRQLADLHAMLSSCAPHYVRCVKPNNLKFPGGFDSDKVLEQLRYAGVLETVRIRRQGFPVRVDFESFVDRYRLLLPTVADASAAEGRGAAERILNLQLADNDAEWQLGKTRVFLRDGQMDALDTLLRRRLNDAAAVIQSRARERSQRRRYQRTRRGFRAMQGQLRRMVARRRFAERLQHVLVVQNLARARVQQWRYARTLAAAAKINAAGRGMLARQLYGRKAREDRRAIQIQAAARGTLARAAYRRELERRDAAARVVTRTVATAAAMHRWRRQKAAVLLLQSASRGFVTRSRYLRGKEMTIMAQSKLKMILQRMAFRKQKKAAIKLASLFRMVPDRRSFWTARAAATFIQSSIRGRLQRAQYRRTLAAAVRMQSCARVWAAQRLAGVKRSERDAATQIQAWRRQRVARRAYKEQREAAVEIAKHARRFLGNREYRAARRAAKMMQAHIRDFQRRTLLKGKVAALGKAAHDADMDGFSTTLLQYPQLLQCRSLDGTLRSLLHFAAHGGDASIAKILLEPAAFDERLAGAALDPAVVDATQDGALHIAAGHGHLDFAKYLLLRGGTVGAGDGAAKVRTASEHLKHMEDGDGKLLEIISRSKGLMSALLKKRKPYNAMWQRRHFVLFPTALAYYRSAKDKMPRGVLSLAGSVISKSIRFKHALELQHPQLVGKGNDSGLIFLQMKTEVDLHAWLSALRGIPGVEFSQMQFKIAGETKSGATVLTDWDKRLALAQQCNAKGETPLHWCALMSDGDAGAKMASLLVANGAPLDGVDKLGRTALHCAVSAANVSVVSYLVQHGADTKARDQQGNTPVDLASKSQRIQRLLVVSAVPVNPSLRGASSSRALSRQSTAGGGAAGESKVGPGRGIAGGLQPTKGTLVSVFFEKVGMEHADLFDRPFIVASVVDDGSVVETMAEPVYSVLQTSSFAWFGQMWHCNTPLEQLSESATVVVEGRTGQGKRPRLECWTSIKVGANIPRPADGGFITGMYKAPVDLSMRKMVVTSSFVDGQLCHARS